MIGPIADETRIVSLILIRLAASTLLCSSITIIFTCIICLLTLFQSHVAARNLPRRRALEKSRYIHIQACDRSVMYTWFEFAVLRKYPVEIFSLLLYRCPTQFILCRNCNGEFDSQSHHLATSTRY